MNTKESTISRIDQLRTLVSVALQCVSTVEPALGGAGLTAEGSSLEGVLLDMQEVLDGWAKTLPIFQSTER